MSLSAAVALAILVLTYVGVAAGRIPGLRLDRTGFAFLGGAAMIALGPMKLDEAFRSIELDTIAMLTGMMIVVAHLKVSGAFRMLGALVIRHAHAPFVLLVTVTVLAGVLSAFLVNDAICLVMTPIVLAGHAGAEAQPHPLSDRDRDRLQLRQRRDHYRQPAEHGDRRGLGDSLRQIHALARARRRLRPRRERRLSSGLCSARNSRHGAFSPDLRVERVHKGQVIKACVVSVGLAVALFAGAPPAEAALIAARDPPLHALDQAGADLSPNSTGRCSSCSPGSSSSSPAREGAPHARAFRARPGFRPRRASGGFRP